MFKYFFTYDYEQMLIFIQFIPTVYEVKLLTPNLLGGRAQFFLIKITTVQVCWLLYYSTNFAYISLSYRSFRHQSINLLLNVIYTRVNCIGMNRSIRTKNKLAEVFYDSIKIIL